MFKQMIFHGAKLLFSSECRLFSFSIARHLSTLFPRPPHEKIHLLTTVDENLPTFSGNTCTFHKNLPPFSPPSLHRDFLLRLPHARTYTRTQRVFDFCLHRTAIHAQPSENKRIVGEAFTRIILFDNQLWINGEEVKAKIKKRRMRAYARVCVVKDILLLHRRRLGMLGKGT